MLEGECPPREDEDGYLALGVEERVVARGHFVKGQTVFSSSRTSLGEWRGYNHSIVPRGVQLGGIPNYPIARRVVVLPPRVNVIPGDLDPVLAVLSLQVLEGRTNTQLQDCLNSQDAKVLSPLRGALQASPSSLFVLVGGEVHGNGPR